MLNIKLSIKYFDPSLLIQSGLYHLLSNSCIRKIIKVIAIFMGKLNVDGSYTVSVIQTHLIYNQSNIFQNYFVIMNTAYLVYTKAVKAAALIYTAASWAFYLSKVASYDIPMFFNSLVDVPYFNTPWAVLTMVVCVYFSLKLLCMITGLVCDLIKFYLRVVFDIKL